jgi:predicted phage terminase large subunit-like protein
MIKDLRFRKSLTSESHYWFFHFYLAEYVKLETPQFHREIYWMTENFSLGHLVIAAFRDSGKSTLLSLSYVLWCIMGKPSLKCIIIVAKTQEQAKLYMKHITDELEKNAVLRADLGPFKARDEWRSNIIILTKYNAMIQVVSSEQSVRGIRHGSSRPQLIVCDDLEDTQSVKTQESRDKLYDWFKNDLLPAREQGARVVVSGAILHKDSLISRLKKEIELGSFHGIYRQYPILDKDNKPIWPGKYPDTAAIEKLRKEIGDDAAWNQEYMLLPTLKESAIVKPKDIHYYEDDELPSLDGETIQFRGAFIGTDQAIKTGSKNDFSAYIPSQFFGYGNKMRLYILPGIINQRFEFPEQISRLKIMSGQLAEDHRATIYCEDVAYQASLAQILINDGYLAEAIKLQGRGKEDRLIMTAHYIRSGIVLFPKHGAELLIRQLLGFGTEDHDDLVDALTLLVNKVTSGNNEEQTEPEVFVTNTSDND